MAIPQNFDTVEQQVLSVSNSNASTSFTTTAGRNSTDVKIVNGGAKACQVLIGDVGLTAVQDASANGTKQVKILSGEVIAIKKSTHIYIAAICEGSDTTTLYLHAGTGG